MNHTTVLISGAGPTGLTLACELARRQVPHRLVERLAAPPRGSRAKGLQPRSLEILGHLGLAEALLAAGHTDLPYRKFAGDQLLGETPRRPSLRPDTRYPDVLLLPQTTVEAALRAKLSELGGAVEWATELVDCSPTATGLTCRLEHPNWTEELTCTYLVACDGGKSPTRKQLGIEFVGETHQQEQLWVGDVEVAGLTPDAWYNWLSPEFGLAFALFPFKHSPSWQLQAVVPPAADGTTPAPTLAGFNQLFQARTHLAGVTFTSSSWQSIYRVNVRRAARYRVGNAFLAGDAAHVHSIAGGLGMNTGIQDAFNLGWKLAAVARGEAADALLDTYAEERIPIAEWLLQTSSDRQRAMLQAATTGQGAFEAIATPDTTQLNLHYRASSLAVPGEPTPRGLQAGDRAPDVQLATGNWLSDQLRGPDWKLLLFGPADVAAPPYLTLLAADDAALRQAYGLSDGLVLIRPDGYIALITTQASEVSTYFARLQPAAGQPAAPLPKQT
ncbi:3-(3-hydroxyphenyl)propionate hydroxylase [Hymenobacter sp. RP-2-7]|uniref:3-(3-hydroxyphenyl)propionate hydroxylase n=1 Tax=Hymenobacter polaris TaxID=2682546 RepID=A0A7Y0AF77_9BACT|nr:FAD-dependent monooxygenase [Hymenobacter polaris]NML66296.1 3-(3-hydroxyphenyl)propionate hydroxylase [Hymenobacter polaris]